LIGLGPLLIRSNAAGRCALLIIELADFLEPGGFGDMLGNDVSQLPEL